MFIQDNVLYDNYKEYTLIYIKNKKIGNDNELKNKIIYHEFKKLKYCKIYENEDKGEKIFKEHKNVYNKLKKYEKEMKKLLKDIIFIIDNNLKIDDKFFKFINLYQKIKLKYKKLEIISDKLGDEYIKLRDSKVPL